MAQSTGARATTFILRELFGELVYFPVWWYTRGLATTWRSLLNRWFQVLNQLSLPILLKTMGKPMYGDYTRSGRIISFFFRIFMVLAKFVALVFWTIMELLVIIAWVVGPILAGAMFVRQIIPLG